MRIYCHHDDTDAASEGDKLVTHRRDFEDEWLDALFTSNNQRISIDLLEEVDDRGRNSYIQKKQLGKTFEKLGYDSGFLPQENISRFSIPEFDGPVADTPLVRAMMYSWLTARKGVVMPKRLGELTPMRFTISAAQMSLGSISTTIPSSVQ